MNWLRIDAATLNHPKMARLARLLGYPHDQAIGVVVSLWMAVAANRESGMLDGWTAVDIAFICRWSGDPEIIVRALVETGWIDQTDQGLAIHEWIEYQGNVEKVRKESALRQQNYRQRHGVQFKENVSNTSVTRDSNARALRSDGPDGPDGRTDGADGADARDVTGNAGALPAAAVAALHPGPDPILATFPCTRGRTWQATESVARKLDEFYPELVMEDEIRDALAWVSADPGERCKPPERMVQFMTGWLKRSATRRNGGAHAQA